MALHQLAGRYHTYLEQTPSVNLADLAFTANAGRNHFEHRLAFRSSSTEVFRQQLASVSGSPQSGTVGVHQGVQPRGQEPVVAFLFTGQGSQYKGMGRELYQSSSFFRDQLNLCSELLQAHLPVPLLEVLYGTESDPSLIHQTRYAQPAIFAIGYSLAKLWQSWGVRPGIVMGHSIGEYVAACIAEVMSLEDALGLIAARGSLMQGLPEGGKMYSVLTSAEAMRPRLQPYEGRVSLAAVNGKGQVVLSGEGTVLDTLVGQLKKEGLVAQALQVSHAFHSPLMRPMVEAFKKNCGEVRFSSGTVAFISTVSGQRAGREITEPSYWADHIEKPVLFSEGLSAAEQSGCTVWLEIGAKPILTGLGKRELKGEHQWLGSLREGRSDWGELLESAGALYCAGVSIDGAQVYAGQGRQKIALPTYPFQRSRYWAESPAFHILGKQLAASTNDSLLDLLHMGKKEEVIEQITKTGRVSNDRLQHLSEILDLIVPKSKKNKEDIETYNIHWIEKPLFRQRMDTEGVKQYMWLLFIDDLLPKALESILIDRDDTFTVVVPGAEFKRIGERTYSLPVSDESSLNRFIQAVWQTDLPLRVVYARGLRENDLSTLRATDIVSKQQQHAEALLKLTKRIGDEPKKVGCKIWVLTQDAIAIDTKDLTNLEASILWGMSRSLALEVPAYWGGIIDMDEDAWSNSAALIINEMASDFRSEQQVAYRRALRFVPRLRREIGLSQQDVPVHPDKSYLITGGMGNIGWQTAHWLVRQGAKYIHLIARNTQLTEAMAQQLEGWQKLGVIVELHKADVSDRETMNAIFKHIQALQPLAGVIHSAGAMDFKLLHDLRMEDFTHMMNTKVTGSWNLHQLTENLHLDFFVGYSSIASVWGSRGQVHYAAANGFLDSLCAYRKQRGLPALSINWGLWKSEKGFGADLLQQTGVFELDVATVWSSMSKLLTNPSHQLAVAHIDWNILKPLFASVGISTFLEEIHNQGLSQPTPEKKEAPVYWEELMGIPAKKQKGRLLQQLQTEVASVLRLPVNTLPDKDQGLFEMGFDSLMALELKGRLERKLNCSLPSTVGFDFPNIQHLTNHLAEVLGLDSVHETRTEKTKAVDTNALLIEDLSVEELAKLLEEELIKNPSNN
jgi:acyl transferase domain-containing protein